MRIHVSEIRSHRADIAIVKFESPLGGATAQWAGTKPDIGALYEVELEVPGLLTWGSDIVETLARESIYEEGGRICLVGCVQSLGDDGVVAIQVGNDIVLVETVGAPSAIPRRVLICVPEIKLFDIDL
jgi:hypothetical protein